jgi:hypothetical protein
VQSGTRSWDNAYAVAAPLLAGQPGSQRSASRRYWVLGEAAPTLPPRTSRARREFEEARKIESKARRPHAQNAGPVSPSERDLLGELSYLCA